MRKISALQLKIDELSSRLISVCREKKLTFGTAESCTGGMIAAAVTSVSGASEAFFGGIVSYDNSVKEQLLGVSHDTLIAHGAVSEETACEMARGAISALRVGFSVAVTGIAGPTGGTKEKPVGLVYIAVADGEHPPLCRRNVFSGNRNDVRLQTVATALEMLCFAVEAAGSGV